MTYMAGVNTSDSGDALTDADLARRIAGRDSAAFELLMRRNNRRLFRAARSIVRDDAEAEDVLQETYLTAFAQISRYRSEARLSTWLTRIAINEALQRIRGRMSPDKFTDSENVIDFEQRAAELRGESERETPERAAMREQTRHMLQRKIDELPVGYRTVFILHAIEDLPFAEIATALEAPEATVRTRFFRARQALRQSLTTDFYQGAREAFFFAGAQCDGVVARVLARLGLRASPDRQTR
jgi:RNA polymerase sigma-70 factor (ECF subfamily)